jgi:hypothetical protein
MKTTTQNSSKTVPVEWLLFPVGTSHKHPATHVAVLVNDALRQDVATLRRAHHRLFKEELGGALGEITLARRVRAVVFSRVPEDKAEAAEVARGLGLTLKRELWHGEEDGAPVEGWTEYPTDGDTIRLGDDAVRYSGWDQTDDGDVEITANLSRLPPLTSHANR